MNETKFALYQRLKNKGAAVSPCVPRRRFLTSVMQHATGLSLLPLAGCATKTPPLVRSARSAALSSSAFQEVVAEFEDQLPALMAEHHVPGLSIATIQDARIAWRQWFGYQDVISRTPVNDQTVFQAASMSKPVFDYAVLKLCEKGVLDLDAPIAPYAPRPFLVGDPRVELITPRHILSHTGGFQDWRSGDEPLKIHFAPGSRFLYSGEGYFYLQSVVSHLTGQMDCTDCASFEAGLEVCSTDIDHFLISAVLAPFHMTSSGYVETTHMRKHLASGHDENGQPFAKHRSEASPRPAMTRYASTGALLTTPTDYAKFIIQILNPKPANKHCLEKKTIDEMLRPQTKVDSGKFTSSWALGWQIQDNGLFNHGGDNKGFHCHAIASRQSQSGFVIMTNGEGGALLIQKLFGSGILNRFFPRNA